MMEASNSRPQTLPPDQDQQMWETVAFFEQMLQTMPDDRVSLEVLAQAYEHAGDIARACDYLVRLADVIVHEEDREAARTLHTRLAEHAGNPRVTEALTRLNILITTLPKHPTRLNAASGTGDKVPASPLDAARLVHDQGYRRQIVSQELDLAWMLHEQLLINEDQYTKLVDDLAELSASTIPAPISILHLFHDRQLPNLDQALGFLAEKSGLPLLPLGGFDPQPDAYLLLPLDYLIVKGVIPFECMSQDLLVAVLNPIAESLRQELSTVTGRTCHFYLVQPSAFDLAIEKIRKQFPEQPSSTPSKAPAALPA